MADGALKRRIEYEMKNDKLLSTRNEERDLHEAYQFLMREYEARHKIAMVISFDLFLHTHTHAHIYIFP